MRKLHRFPWPLILLAALSTAMLGTWISTPSQLQAHEGKSIAGSPILRIAAIGIKPVETASLLTIFSPETLPPEFNPFPVQRPEDLWPLPTAEATWPLVDDQPLIETRTLQEFWHTVSRGHTVKNLRSMYRLSTAALQELNPELNLNNLKEGDRVLIWKRASDTFARSVGAANRGRIIDAEPLPEGSSYLVLYPHRAWGTYYTVSEIVRVLDAFAEQFPDADPLIVGDISYRNGRAIHPHQSHQAGRDVDITYPRLLPPPDYNRFHHVRRDNLDVDKTLWLINQFIAGGQVQYFFIDRYHQRTLYREAKRRGAPEEWLKAVFQYPAHSGGTALIRHARGHRKHFHIRFKCQPTDRRCQ